MTSAGRAFLIEGAASENALDPYFVFITGSASLVVAFLFDSEPILDVCSTGRERVEGLRLVMRAELEVDVPLSVVRELL